MATDIELLEAEIDTLWRLDSRGRLVRAREPNGKPAPDLLIAVAREGQIAVIGSEVPDTLANELLLTVVSVPPSHEPDSPPAGLDRCQQLLEDGSRPVERASGPSYVVPRGTAYASGVSITRSTDAGMSSLRDRNPAGANWSAEEWNLLLDGALGPWAMATIEGRVISICHSARLAQRGAEAGVWTDPAFRGQGHAAAVTAAWASLLEASGRHIFYSTSAGNRSSQRVAARLGLRPIGWMWQLARLRPA